MKPERNQSSEELFFLCIGGTVAPLLPTRAGFERLDHLDSIVAVRDEAGKEVVHGLKIANIEIREQARVDFAKHRHQQAENVARGGGKRDQPRSGGQS